MDATAATWTLSELVEEAATALARVPAPDNGQIRAVPDERSLRYYTTLGLIDRPAAMRGRTALYTARHLAQVVAIKRLQGTGKSLAEIQEIMSAIDDATLARLSGVALPRRAPRAPARETFWTQEPTTPAEAIAPAAASPAPEPTRAPRARPKARRTVRITLSPGVELSLDTTNPVVDVEAVATAASALLLELAAQGLLEDEG